MYRYCWILTMVFMLLLVGCQNSAVKVDQLITKNENQSTANSGQVTNKAQKQIALVMKTLTNPFFVEMEKGARQAEKELGIRLIVKTGAKETSIDQQISIIEELILQKVDAIVIAPGSSELIPVLKKAQDAGIAIINIDNRLDPELAKKWGLVNVPFISVDNEQSAYLSAQFISKQISTPTEAVILEGIRGASNAEERKKGAIRAFQENKNIKVVAMETANWKIDEAYQVTSSLYQKHPNIRAIFCANDMMALGTIRYLHETGKKNVLVAAYDALDEAKTAIRDGWLAATVDQHAAKQGYLGVVYAAEILNGKKQPVGEVKLIDAELVHLGNLQ